METTGQLPDSRITSGQHISYWTDSTEPIRFEPLEKDVKTEVVIVGGGISGLSVAYTLASKGKSVVVLEDGNIGSGETGRTTAHIVNALDDRYYEIERVFGKEGARLAAESHTAAINHIEAIIQKEKISCDFKRVSGYLFMDPSDKDESMDKEFAALERAGIDAVRHSETPFLKNHQKNCIEFKNQAQFHPLKYLKGLADAIVRYGGTIHTLSRVTKINGDSVETENGNKVTGKHIVVATNSPINNKFVMHLRQYPFRTYVIGATIKKGSLPAALWWDTGDFEADADIAPYHYVRIQEYSEKYDLLICGGEDHPTGLPEAMEKNETSSYSKLEGWTRARFNIEDVIYKWSGQVLEPMDSLAFIGRNPMDKNNVYIVTGDSGNGMTHGTIAGILIPDLINGVDNPWEELYDPRRTHYLKTGKTFIKEVFGGMIDYIRHLPKHSDRIRLSEIKAGDAKIIEMEKEKFGAYRDEENALHIVSATCTHMGCTVRWNKDEKSWDCPCHGSRFAPDGSIMNGPAKNQLLYYKEQEDMQEHHR